MQAHWRWTKEEFSRVDEISRLKRDGVNISAMVEHWSELFDNFLTSRVSLKNNLFYI